MKSLLRYSPLALLLVGDKLPAEAFRVPSHTSTLSKSNPLPRHHCNGNVALYLSDTPENWNPAKLKSVFLDGEVGQRAEAWTAAAALLLVSILAGAIPLPIVGTAFPLLAGPGLILLGGGVILLSLTDLGSQNLTPFLSPVKKGSLVTDGIYSKIRHPIYSGLMALCLGFSVTTGDANRLVITALLILLLDIKAAKEEEFLMERFPEYDSYRATTGKFIPGDLFVGK